MLGLRTINWTLLYKTQNNNDNDDLLQKEYKSIHDRVGKVIHLESMKLKFGHVDKLYIYLPNPSTQTGCDSKSF